ncbi:MAG: hypothetical protein ACYDCI_05775 [Candidatus Limnocylindrales bacterium]
MTDRAKALEAVQIGLEVTPGTAVAAPTNIRGLSIDIGMGGQADFFRPDGRKFNAVVSPNAEWSTWAMNGKPTYTEICYPLEAIFGQPVVTAVGTTGKMRTYTMSDVALANPQTLTIQKGNSVRAEQIAYGVLHDFGMTFSRIGGLTVTGQGLGQLFTDGITMTASPADVPLIPVIGKQLLCYIDATAAALGTTKLLRAFTLEPTIQGAYGPIWTIDSALGSFAGVIDLAPTTGVKLTVEADATGMGYLTQYRAGTLIFLRIDGQGAAFEAGHNYEFTYDVCLGIKTVTPDQDDNGVTVVQFDCEFVKDSTWGKALSIAVTNTIVTL